MIIARIRYYLSTHFCLLRPYLILKQKTLSCCKQALAYKKESWIKAEREPFMLLACNRHENVQSNPVIYLLLR